MQELLSRVPGLRRLRLSSVDPVELDEELWDAFATESRLMPHLHLSLQSGHDLILKRMKRRHSRDDVRRVVERARRMAPRMVFGADLIAGFPTETDAMFEETLALVDELDLVYLHVFPYSPRPGTPASRLPQLAKEIRKERAARLRTAGERNHRRFLQSKLGRTEELLMESGQVGRTRDFARMQVDTNAPAGTFLSARAERIDGDRLVGVFAKGPDLDTAAAPQ